MGCCCHKEAQPTRKIHFDRMMNQKLRNNLVQTTQYTWWNFLPKAILIQFLRPANFVYLISAVLQSIDVISSLNPITAIAPFIFVIVLSISRQAYEYYRRYKIDMQINNRITHRLINKEFNDISWQQVHVGDILKIKNNEVIPADILILHTSQENSLCYVETANLDGETNLKAKYAHVDSIKVFPEDYESVSGSLIIDYPNSDLHGFSGFIQMKDQSQKHIDFENIILRETILKNTDEVVGLVIYTGYDTKIAMNQGKVQTKMSKVEKKVNFIQIILLVVLIVLASVCTIGYTIIHNQSRSRDSYFYLMPQVSSPKTECTPQIIIAALIFFSSFLLLTFLIPISLNVSIEVIKAFLGIMLGFDNKMYYEPINKRCNVNNFSIIEELGCIDYVLTDKTGTLTANQMVFKNLVIGHSRYDSTYIATNVDILKNNPDFHRFWMCLVICHDVVCDPETHQYQGSSPDEVCFINYAKTIGYQFTKRTKNSLELYIHGQKIVYQLLEIISFDPRKRMSVIVKNLINMKIEVYTKGADSAIFSQALPSEHSSTLRAGINDFAKDGYRTLLFSYRQIAENDYEALKTKKSQIRVKKLQKSLSVQQITLQQDELIKRIESKLILLGATAIEDRLQDQVPETIARLQDAGIVVMMITGDKLETAENIGYLANFIKNEAEIVRISADIKQEDMIDKFREILEKTDKDHAMIFSLIVEGTSINQVLKCEETELIHEILASVSSVIFCRSSPKEKASIVRYVKKVLNGLVLAIGDGGNDVGMIQQANVGVGILGKEGNSASVVSDFSIGQFKYLDRLVLHHGRWFYYRLSYFFVYYGWKNLMMTLLLFFYMIDSAFSAKAGLSDAFIGIYNIIIGLCLVVYYAIFEQDINDDQYPPAYKDLPKFYRQIIQRDLFSYKRYIIWTFFSCLIAVIIFVTVRYSIGSIHSINNHGLPGDFGHYTEAVAIALSIIVTMVLVMDIKMFTWFSFGLVFLILTVGGCIFFFLITNYVRIDGNYLILNRTDLRFWLVIFLNVAIVYVGKQTIDTIYREKYPSAIEQAIKLKKQYQSSHYIHVNGNGSLQN